MNDPQPHPPDQILRETSRSIKSAAAVGVIVLDQDGKECKLAYKDQQIFAGRGQVVLWIVTNNCPDEKEVSLRDWSKGDPLEPGPRKRRVPGGQTGILQARVKTNVNVGAHFPYLVDVDGRVFDPEIVIEY